MNGYELDLELLNRKKKQLNIEIKASKLELANVAKQIRNVKVNMFRSKVTTMLKKNVDKFKDIVNTSIVDRVKIAGYVVAQTIFNSVEKTLDFKNRIVNFKNDKVNKVRTSLSNISTVTKNKIEEIMYNLSHILELKKQEEERKNTSMQEFIDRNVGIIRNESNINKKTTMFKAPLANIDLRAKKIIYNGIGKALTVSNRVITFKNDSVMRVRTGINKLFTSLKEKVELFKYNLYTMLEQRNKQEEERKNTSMQEFIDRNVGIIRNESNINKKTTMFKAPLANIDLRAKKIIYNGIGKALTVSNRVITFKNDSVMRVRTGINKVSSFTKNFVNDKVSKIKNAFVPDISERKELIEQLQAQKEALLQMKEQNRELNQEGYKKVRSMGFLSNTPLLFLTVLVLSALAFVVAVLVAK